MQNTMLDSTISCTPSTLNFICDVDGVHTEIPIPSSAWDFENETVWLTQAQLAELYKTSVQNVGRHIGNILEDEELPADSTIKDSFIVQLEGNREVSRDKDKVTITDSKEIGVINDSLITQQTFNKNTPNVVLISESGLYRIFAKCNLPKCEPDVDEEQRIYDALKEKGVTCVTPFSV